MANFIANNESSALISINESLKIAPELRDSLLLMSKILDAMGGHDEAIQIKEDAEFLPQSGDRTERATVE